MNKNQLYQSFLFLLVVISTFLSASFVHAENSDSKIIVGVPTVLSGDLAVMGDNLRKTVDTYKRVRLRHPIEFIFEDAKKSSADGLSAYQKLINIDHVSMLIGGTTSNGTLASAPLINSSKTVLITPLTGGSNIDRAGPYIFRVGNSDILNGVQQADQLMDQGITRVALFTELTEYTQDIAQSFRRRYSERGGAIVFDQDFTPDLSSFKSVITKLNRKAPQAIVMSTQTGLAFGIFIRELRELKGLPASKVFTNFVAAANPDAYTAAGDALDGVNYLEPAYDHKNPELIKFFSEFESDHGTAPAIPMHTAGTYDALEMLQKYLDLNKQFSREGFQQYLLANVKNYQGLMGTYSFDSEGNAEVGFVPARIMASGR